MTLTWILWAGVLVSVALVPALLCFAIITWMRGWWRVVAILPFALLPMAGWTIALTCNEDTIIEPCFIEGFYGFFGVIFAIGVAAGLIAAGIRHYGALRRAAQTTDRITKNPAA